MSKSEEGLSTKAVEGLIALFLFFLTFVAFAMGWIAAGIFSAVVLLWYCWGLK